MKTAKAITRQFSIGDVQAMKSTTGDERVELLRQFYRGRQLFGARFFVQGVGFIRRDQVNWDTAGERVTGP